MAPTFTVCSDIQKKVRLPTCFTTNNSSHFRQCTCSNTTNNLLAMDMYVLAVQMRVCMLWWFTFDPDKELLQVLSPIA